MQNNEFTVNILNADQLYVEGKRIQQLDLGTLVSSDTGSGYGIGIKTDKPRVTFDISGTDGLRIPFGNTSSRPQNIRFTGTAGESTDYKGVIRYNTETEKYESWLGTNAQTSWGRFVIEDEDYYTTDISSNILIRGNHTIWGINGDENNSSGNLTLRAGGTIDKQGQVNYIGTNISNADKSSKITLTGGNSTNISLTTANQDRMIIDSNGKIGIGVTSPVHNVDISANQTMVTNNTSVQSKVITNSAFDSKNITNNNMYLMLQHGTGNSSGGIFSGIARSNMGGFSLGVKYNISIKNIINANSEGFMNINIGQNIHDDKLFLAPYVFGFNPALTTSKFVKLDNNKSNNSNLFISNMEFSTLTQQTNFGKNGVFIGKGCTLYSDITNDPELLIFGDNPISNGGVTPQSNGGGILLSDKMRFVTYKDTSFVADSGITSHLGQAISHSKKLQLNSVTRMVIDKDGNVGIGTDNPVSKLDINGTLTISNNINKANNTYTGDFVNKIVFRGDREPRYQDSPPQAFMGDVGVIGWKYDGLGPGDDANSGSAAFIIETRRGRGDPETGTLTERFRVSSNGNIGIGTINPGSKLTFETIPSNPDTFSWTNGGNTSSAVSGIDVSPRLSKFVGNGISWKSKYQSWGANDLSEGSSDNVARIFYQPVTFHSIHSYGENNQTGVGLYRSGRLVFTCGDNEDEGKYARMVLNSRGYVGIGTTDPQAELDVKASQKTDTTLRETAGINFSTDNGNTSWSVGYIGGYISAGVNNDTGNYPGGLLFRTRSPDPQNQPGTVSPDVRMVINAIGNVGIGATDPREKLDINGALHIRGTSATTYNNDTNNSTHYNNTYLSFAPLGSVSDWAYLRQIGENNLIHMALDFHDDDNDARFSIRSVKSTANPHIVNTRFTVQNDKVGIGISNPQKTLDVGDTSLFRGEMQWRYQNSSSWHRSHALYGPNKDWYIRSGSSSGQIIIQDTGGNVCIGSGPPTQKLHVNGNIYSTGWIRSNDTGSLLKSYYYRNSETATTAITNLKTSSYSIVVEKTVNPSATGVRFKVSFDCNYDVGGWGTDEYRSRIVAKQSNSETELIHKEQKWRDGNHGQGTRSGVLFPIIGVFHTTSTSSVQFRVEVRGEGSVNDVINIYRNNGLAFIIEEIKD